VAHDLIGKPASTFPDHAQAAASQEAWHSRSKNGVASLAYEAGRRCSDISSKSRGGTPTGERAPPSTLPRPKRGRLDTRLSAFRFPSFSFVRS
jgi:hypothetical protein